MRFLLPAKKIYLFCDWNLLIKIKLSFSILKKSQTAQSVLKVVQ